jgi:hypothetical protein
MSKKTIVTVLGAVVVVLPFLGLPNSISTPIFILCGIGIIYIARVGKRKNEPQK